MHLNTPYFVLHANGNGNVYKSNKIDFEFIPIKVYDLISEFEIPIYNLEGIIKGNLRGALDSLNAKVSLDVANIHYDSIRVKELRSNFQIYLFDSLYNGFVNLDANAINYNTLAFN